MITDKLRVITAFMKSNKGKKKRTELANWKTDMIRDSHNEVKLHQSTGWEKQKNKRHFYFGSSWLFFYLFVCGMLALWPPV